MIKDQKTAIAMMLFFLLNSPLLSLAQYTVQGKVTDTSDGTPHFIEGAVVHLLQQKDSIMQTAITNKDGFFRLSASKGSYQMDIRYWGKTIYHDTIDLQKDVTLGNIIAFNAAPNVQLNEIIIKGAKPGIQLANGNLVFTPHIVSAGSAFDILKITPLVLVRGKQITISGKGSPPHIKVNGKRLYLSGALLANYLESISANDIEKIEIAKNSMAGDDAGSNSGFINIILKKMNNKEGFDGNVYINYAQATYGNTSEGATFNLFRKKFRWSNTVGYNNGKDYQLGTNKIHYPTYLLKEKSIVVSKQNTPLLNSTLEYNLNGRNDLEANITYSRMRQNNAVDNHSLFRAQNQTDSSYSAIGDNPQTLQNLSLNAFFEHRFDTLGKKITFDANYVQSGFKRDQELFNTQYDAEGNPLGHNSGIKNGNNQNMNLATVDIETQFPTKFARLSWGAKLSFIANLNHSYFYEEQASNWIPDYSRFDRFNYYENTQALFFKASKDIGKWELLLGLRAERTRTSGESIVSQQQVRRNYLMLFPSGNLAYKLNDKNVFSLSYARKVTRPTFEQVNPYVNYLNQYSYFTGNPFLQPFFSHNVNLTYMLQQKWVFDLSYMNSNNGFSELELTEPNTNIRKGTIDNFLTYSGLSLDVNTRFNIADIWQIYPDLAVSNFIVTSKSPAVKDGRSFTGYITLYNQIKPWSNKEWYLDLSGHYYFPNKSGIMQTNATWGESLGITYQTHDKKLQCSLFINDLWKTDIMSYNSIVNDVLRERYKYNDSRRISLTIRYNFKHGHTKAIQQRKKTNQEELNRIRH